jgi:ADP-sugar diphosphatase
MGNRYIHPTNVPEPSNMNNESKKPEVPLIKELKVTAGGHNNHPPHEVLCTSDNIDLNVATNATPFKEWLEKFNTSEMQLNRVHFQSIDMFGKKVGFLKFVAYVEKDGKSLPGIVFMRGPAVAILTILVDPTGKEFVLCTNQARVPVGDYLLEVPAGMIDEGGNFKGQVALEMKEETGIEIKDHNLKDLTEMAYGKRYQGIMPSPGGCDEYLKLFVYREQLSKEKITELEGKLTGVVEQGEYIKLKVLPLENLWRETCDVKAICCLYLYDKFKNELWK